MKIIFVFQLRFAGVLTCIYGPVQLIVLVGIIIQMSEDGLCSPTAMFFIFVAAIFVFTAFFHPKEWKSVVYGLVYFPLIPSK